MSLKSQHKWPVPVKPLAADTRVPIPAGLLQKPEEQTQWCWAACIQLDHNYRYPIVPKQQCDLANDVPRLGPNCCAAPDPCNDGLELAEIDQLFHHSLILSKRVDSALDVKTLKGQLAAGQPVGVGLSWGHMVMVHGWYQGAPTDQFLVYDPMIPGPTDGSMSYKQLVDYGGTGAWVTSWENL